MNFISSNTDDKYLQNIYDAIVDYHNNLVQTRFTIAGLFLAATGFLMNSWFSLDPQNPFKFFVPILGIILTIICILLEVRTYLLLYDMGARGLEIEAQMKVNKNIGFFGFMDKQNIKLKFRILPEKFSTYLLKKVFTHTGAFFTLYTVIILSWVLLFLFRGF